MSTTVIGLDPSSRRLVTVAGAPDTLVMDLWVDDVVLKDNDIVVRAQDACVWVADQLSQYTRTLLAVESPVFGKGGVRATVTQSIVHGAILAATAGRSDVITVQSNNQHWKKVVVGRGNASKDQITEWVKLHHREFYDEHCRTLRNGRIAIDQDVMDALCIWIAACSTLDIMRRVKGGSSPLSVIRENKGVLHGR